MFNSQEDSFQTEVRIFNFDEEYMNQDSQEEDINQYFNNKGWSIDDVIISFSLDGDHLYYSIIEVNDKIVKAQTMTTIHRLNVER